MSGTTAGPRYKRILLKLSGEALMGRQQYGLDPELVAQVAAEVKSVVALGVQVCLVVGPVCDVVRLPVETPVHDFEHGVDGRVLLGVGHRDSGERHGAVYRDVLAPVVVHVASQRSSCPSQG